MLLPPAVVLSLRQAERVEVDPVAGDRTGRDRWQPRQVLRVARHEGRLRRRRLHERRAMPERGRAERDVSKNVLLSDIDAKKNLLALEEARRALAQLPSDIQSHSTSS